MAHIHRQRPPESGRLAKTVGQYQSDLHPLRKERGIYAKRPMLSLSCYLPTCMA
jgi:hypothetical protein